MKFVTQVFCIFNLSVAKKIRYACTELVKIIISNLLCFFYQVYFSILLPSLFFYPDAIQFTNYAGSNGNVHLIPSKNN